MKLKKFVLARENFQKPPFLSQARAKKGRFFYFLLFYKQNALIYAGIFFNSAKYTHISPEKLAWPSPRKCWAASGPDFHNYVRIELYENPKQLFKFTINNCKQV